MKPLERVFFMACLMRGDNFIRDICQTFSELGFPIKILWRYLEKWNDKGFYDYGVALDMGWFCIDKLPVEYAKMYEEVQEWQQKMAFELENANLSEKDLKIIKNDICKTTQIGLKNNLL